ncbi:MAG: cysteine-rich VLP domain-containing protein [bacterium]|nr:cysteine-rich VLP domain-containing protein [bacterium]
MSDIIRMTPEQARRCKALIKNQCCNYFDGNCILLDDGEPCICPQSISYSLNCKWFRTAVLPNDNDLYIRLMKPKNRKKCTVCGNEYTPTGRNSKYCDKCRKIVWNKQKADYIRKKRYESRNFKP